MAMVIETSRKKELMCMCSACVVGMSSMPLYILSHATPRSLQFQASRDIYVRSELEEE